MMSILLAMFSDVASADIQSDVRDNLPLPQIVQRALDRQETAANIAVELIKSCVKVAHATGAVLKAVPGQAVNVTEAVVKAVVVDDITDKADCRQQTTHLASTEKTRLPYYKAANTIELEDITINEVPYITLSEVAATAINTVPHLKLAIVINALPTEMIKETVNAVKSITRRDVVAVVIKNEVLSDTVVNSQVILDHQSDVLAVAINLAGVTNNATAETSRTVVMLTDLDEKRRDRDGAPPKVIHPPEGGTYVTPLPTGSQGGAVSPSR